MKNILFLIFLGFVFSCKPQINQENLITEDVTFLASDALEGRQTGTKGEKEAATYIENRFKQLGLQPKGTSGFLQTFSFKPKTNPHDEVKFDVNGDGTITGNNVIGFLNVSALTKIKLFILLFLIYKGDTNNKLSLSKWFTKNIKAPQLGEFSNFYNDLMNTRPETASEKQANEDKVDDEVDYDAVTEGAIIGAW